MNAEPRLGPIEPRLQDSGAGKARAEPARARARRRRRWLSPLTRRILTLNLLALAIPVAGLLYLDDYRDNLVEARLASLRTQAELFAGALGSSGVVTGPLGDEQLLPETTRHTVRRLVDVAKVRARLFDAEGLLLADSFKMSGPAGQVEIEILPAEASDNLLGRALTDLYDWVVALLPAGTPLPLYRELPEPKAGDYPEAAGALVGEVMTMVRRDEQGGLLLSVAVPVQRYRQVLGVLMISTDGRAIEDSVRQVRFGILQVFGIAFAITVLISIYLAGTIARPISKLAEAAERVRRGHGRQTAIPDFTRRRDEIGDLSGSLRDMTQALWTRMDAIERFAADVAHEIKNPLTSLRSAVETVARLEDPVQQRKLMSIIIDDVQRLNRLISDISDASRLDAELSRAEAAPVDLGRMVEAIAELQRATAAEGAPKLETDIAGHQLLVVNGLEDRLVQVLRNLIANAVSFSPPGGAIRITVAREEDQVRLMVEDRGPGIPPGKEEAIFDRFYSERPKSEKFGSHSGLGLSISKQIIEAHGGRIWAENRLARDADDGPATAPIGARFTILLPVAERAR